MKVCTKCKKEYLNDDNHNYCNVCGKELITFEEVNKKIEEIKQFFGVDSLEDVERVLKEFKSETGKKGKGIKKDVEDMADQEVSDELRENHDLLDKSDKRLLEMTGVVKGLDGEKIKGIMANLMPHEQQIFKWLLEVVQEQQNKKKRVG